MSKPRIAFLSLVFLVGGDPATLERVRPVLLAMGKAIIHLKK